MKKVILFLFAIQAFSLFAQKGNEDVLKMSNIKATQTLGMIDYFYVDTTDLNKICEKGIEAMLKELDPHSVFIDKDEVAKMNEPLVGNFDGIGVSFQLLDDTIHVVDVISGGPSEKVGVLAGDKIVKVDDMPATGDTIKNDWVFKHLRGKKGTKVSVSVIRGKSKTPIVFEIKRDKIPINSIDTWFMIDKEIGYIRLNRFAQSSNEEMVQAITELQSEGMQSLILDLRGNGGGYLNVAVDICDQFLSGDKLIVYTKGAKSPRQELKAQKKGLFEQGRLVIMVDESSASASEILSGAVQDWDRGVIVARRTFGKGLVQRPFDMYDGSQIRLTTSRYYTPSGRCIQKPYDAGVEEYQMDYYNRLSHGELLSADSVHFADSLRCFTSGNRLVYGGGGIMPDVFVPSDTMGVTSYYMNVVNADLLQNFAFEYADLNRADLTKAKTVGQLLRRLPSDGLLLSSFVYYASQKGVPARWYYINISRTLIVNQLKAIIARNILGWNAFYEVLNSHDPVVLEAIKQLHAGTDPLTLDAMKDIKKAQSKK